MRFNRNQSLKKEAGGAPPNNSPTKEKGRRRYKITAAILAIFVLHFAWQFSFIQRENLRMAEDSLNTARLDVLPVEDQTAVEPVEITTETAAKTSVVERTVKSVVPVKYTPPENNRPPVELKKKAAREPRSERLRRAEKLLTGF